MSEGLRAMWMRGGTSKGGYFLADDLPADAAKRDDILLRILGSPDPRQIDGLGGADPLTSKVAVVSPSSRDGADVDYLFLQVSVDQPVVSDSQNCGNILAGVGPFALERGLVEPADDETAVRVRMVNSGRKAVVRVQTPGRRVEYAGNASIDGVPGTAAAIGIEFQETAGSTCGTLFPSGTPADRICGIETTLVDNGMPVAIVRAADLGLSGDEAPTVLEANAELRRRLEEFRLSAGPIMNLGDVRGKPVPKLAIVSRPRSGGAITTRVFIPHRCHKSIGVLGAVSVATAALTPGAVGSEFAVIPSGNPKSLSIEHPSGETTVLCSLDGAGTVARAEIVRTARKLFDGTVFPAPVAHA